MPHYVQTTSAIKRVPCFCVSLKFLRKISLKIARRLAIKIEMVSGPCSTCFWYARAPAVRNTSLGSASWRISYRRRSSISKTRIAWARDRFYIFTSPVSQQPLKIEPYKQHMYLFNCPCTPCRNPVKPVPVKKLCWMRMAVLCQFYWCTCDLSYRLSIENSIWHIVTALYISHRSLLLIGNYFSSS